MVILLSGVMSRVPAFCYDLYVVTNSIEPHKPRDTRLFSSTPDNPVDPKAFSHWLTIFMTFFYTMQKFVSNY